MVRTAVLSYHPSTRQIARFLGVGNMPIPLLRPYAWSMSAASVDGRIALMEKDYPGGHNVASACGQYQSSTDLALLTYGWRSADAVLTSGAVLRAEPSVIYQRWGIDRRPLTIIVSGSGEFDLQHPVFTHSRTITITTKSGRDRLKSSLASSSDHKILVAECQQEEGSVDLSEAMHHLRTVVGVRRLDVTAGGKTIAEFLRLRLLDEMRVTMTNTVSQNQSSFKVKKGG